MTRVLNPLTAALWAFALLLAAPLHAQGSEARATLYTRVAEGRAHAAVVLRITPQWYIYHTDLGHPDAVGKPLEITLSAEGIEWGEPVLPEPRVKEVADGLDGPYWFNYHSGRVVAYATGTLAGGASAEEVEATLSGLTCNDVKGTCVSYDETVSSKGEGKDKYWEDWPASLGASPVEPQEEEPAAEEAPSVPGPPVDFLPPGLGVEDEEELAGPVEGTLWVRVDEEASAADAVVELVIPEGYHVGHGPSEEDLGHPDAIGMPTVLEIEGGGVEWGEVSYPQPERYDQGIPDPDGEGNIWMHGHHGRVLLRVAGAVVDDPDPAQVSASVYGQLCDEEGCQLFDLALAVTGEGPDEAFVRPTPSATTAPADDSQGSSGLLLFLLSAVGWGIFTLLMPCTYPMIPITISFFTKQAETRSGRVLPLSLTYGLGIVLVFIFIGLAAAPVIIPFATHPVTNLVIGALFLGFAFVLFGMINLQPPAVLMRAAGKASATGGYLGVFLMGATLVVTSFTCTAPFVGTLLGSAATGKGIGADALRIVLGMGVFGLTMATPSAQAGGRLPVTMGP